VHLVGFYHRSAALDSTGEKAA